MKKAIEQGRKFGKLSVIRETDKRMHGSVVYLCRCDCGSEVEVPAQSLLSGHTQSCGCIRKNGEYKKIYKKASEAAAKPEAIKKRVASTAKYYEENPTKALEVKNRMEAEREKILVDGTNIARIKNADKTPINNTSGHVGVFWRKEKQRWVARIQLQGKRYILGSFEKFEDAVAARQEGEKRIYGEFLDKHK